MGEPTCKERLCHQVAEEELVSGPHHEEARETGGLPLADSSEATHQTDEGVAGLGWGYGYHRRTSQRARDTCSLWCAHWKDCNRIQRLETHRE